MCHLRARTLPSRAGVLTWACDSLLYRSSSLQLLLLLADPDNRTADGLHLVDPATGRRFDLIFLDIMMQRSNGEEVCQQLRAAGIKTPVVAATGNGVKEDLDRYSGAGFSSVLLKPFSSTTVTGVVRALVPCTAPVMSDATGTMTPPA